MKNHTETHFVGQRPKCDYCGQPASYDGKTRGGPWAFMCEVDFQQHGVGLGLGRGQRLLFNSDEPVEAGKEDE